ncbi:TniQ family protein [Pseudomonas shirazica]|uniref:TniQ family protein n=1 Tax=Pseudomonas shirazica TaxID=1940636 RepID=UPI0011186A92|nr:TniQ family protein [Pseudomonas shirazica]
MDNLSSIPLPKPDESPISLFYRCCKNNGFQTPNQLIRNQKLRFSSLTQTFCKGSKFFSFLMRQEILLESEANRIANSFFETTLKDREIGLTYKDLFFPGKFIRGHLALCPSCIRDGFLHNMHLFSWSNVCPKHNEEYITTCPECHETLAWAELRDYHCPCGYNLRETEPLLTQDPFHEILDHAVATADPDFFSTAYELLATFQYFRTQRNASTLTKACHQIALGGAANFFKAIASLQQLYPTLHRIALIAPLLKFSHKDIRNHSLEYLYTVSQSLPSSHAGNCDCNELKYTLSSAKLLTKGSKNFAHLISEKQIRFVSPKGNCYIKKLIYSENLCEMLMKHPAIEWNNFNSTPKSKKDFKLITLGEACQELELTIADAITLAQTGKIKTLRLTSTSGALISKGEVTRFSQNFTTLTNIRKFSTLRPDEISDYLRNIPSERISIDFRPIITLYQRELLPEAILFDLKQRDHRLRSKEGVVSFSDAAKVLNLDPKDIRPLIDLGIIKSTTHINSRRLKGRTMCLTSSVLAAKKWKEEHLTILETAKLADCSQKMITKNYLKQKFVPFLKLRTTSLILKKDAVKLIEHIKKHITLPAIMSKYNLTSSAITTLIASNTLTPLQSSHKDFLTGSVTFIKGDVHNALETKYSKHSGFNRVSRVRNKFRPT